MVSERVHIDLVNIIKNCSLNTISNLSHTNGKDCISSLPEKCNCSIAQKANGYKEKMVSYVDDLISYIEDLEIKKENEEG